MLMRLGVWLLLTTHPLQDVLFTKSHAHRIAVFELSAFKLRGLADQYYFSEVLNNGHTGAFSAVSINPNLLTHLEMRLHNPILCGFPIVPQALIAQDFIAVYTAIPLQLPYTEFVYGDDMPEIDKQSAAVYVSWKTFQNSIEQLSKAELPNVIDKTVFPGMAFSVQNQLFTGMRFLGLIDDKNKPMAELESLAVNDEATRKNRLKEILQRRYSDLFALNLKKTTPDELDKKMLDVYGMKGDTREKAVRFFIGAAKYLGLEMSPLFDSSKTPSSPRPSNGAKKKVTRKTPDPNTGRTSAAGTSKTVRLQSGGTLMLSATLDLFSLNADDRKFVFELIDKLEAYQQPPEQGTTEPPT